MPVVVVITGMKVRKQISSFMPKFRVGHWIKALVGAALVVGVVIQDPIIAAACELREDPLELRTSDLDTLNLPDGAWAQRFNEVGNDAPPQIVGVVAYEAVAVIEKTDSHWGSAIMTPVAIWGNAEAVDGTYRLGGGETYEVPSGSCETEADLNGPDLGFTRYVLYAESPISFLYHQSETAELWSRDTLAPELTAVFGEPTLVELDEPAVDTALGQVERGGLGFLRWLAAVVLAGIGVGLTLRWRLKQTSASIRPSD